MSAGICTLKKTFSMSSITHFPKKWLVIPAAMLAILVFFSFRPLPAATSENCVAVKGEVTKITSEGSDLVVVISGNDGYYYINRALDNGTKAEMLSSQLLNKPVTLYYIKHWSLLNFNGKTRHIARIEVNGQVAYNEWKYED
jgi:hypothetical protein